MAPVIFMPHVGGCPECARYVAQLGTAVDRLREWATRPLLLVAAEDGSRAASAAQPFAGQPGLIALVDVTGTGRAQLGGGKEQAIVVQADRWGAVYDVQASGLSKDQHAALPTPEDLVALAKFIDIQCPECGIPSKEWLGVSPFPLG
jgi:hypothetical protein